LELITIILVAFVLVLSIILRSVDVLRFYAFGSDTFGNLLYSKWLGDSSFNLYKVGRIVYPPFLPKLLYHLQRRLSLRLLHLIPKIFDLLTSLAVFLFTLWLSGSEFIAFLALLFYTFSPVNVISAWGISTRNIGSFFLMFTLFTSYVAIANTNVRYIMPLLAIVSGTLMMLTSRIAYKSYYIIVVATVILWPIKIQFSMFLLIAVLSSILCLLITKRGFIDQLKEQIFLINYFKNRRKEKGKKESMWKQITVKFDIFKFDLWWIAGVLAFIYSVSTHSLNDFNLFLSTWLFTIIALSFLWPWGEGERHIMLGTAPASILAASYLSEQPLIIIPFLAVETFIIARRSLLLLKGKDLVSVDRHLLKFFNTMKETMGESLILCLPPVYSFTVAYLTEKKVLFGDGASQEGIHFQSKVIDSTKTEKDMEELVEKYSVTHLFVDKNHFPLSISSNKWEPVLHEENFIVLRRKDGKNFNYS